MEELIVSLSSVYDTYLRLSTTLIPVARAKRDYDVHLDRL